MMKYKLVNYSLTSPIVCVVDENGDLVKKFDRHNDWQSNYEDAQEWLKNNND